MSVFATVAATGSLSAAARKLNLPLTTVSRQLAALEEHVGAALVARTTRRLALTSAGRRYLETTTHVLDEIAAAESQIAGRADPMSGALSITAPLAFGRLHVLPFLLRFLADYPKVDARLHLVDQIVDLTSEDIDVAVRIGSLPDSALLATRVGAVRMTTCASPEYLRRRGRPPEPAALIDHDCIAFSTLAGCRWTFDCKAHGRQTVQVHARLAVTTAEAAIAAAAAGLGVARVMSYQAAEAIAQKQLTPLLANFDDKAIPINVVRRDRLRPRLVTQQFSEALVRALRAERFSV